MVKYMRFSLKKFSFTSLSNGINRNLYIVPDFGEPKTYTTLYLPIEIQEKPTKVVIMFVNNLSFEIKTSEKKQKKPSKPRNSLVIQHYFIAIRNTSKSVRSRFSHCANARKNFLRTHSYSKVIETIYIYVRHTHIITFCQLYTPSTWPVASFGFFVSRKLYEDKFSHRFVTEHSHPRMDEKVCSFVLLEQQICKNNKFKTVSHHRQNVKWTNTSSILVWHFDTRKKSRKVKKKKKTFRMTFFPSNDFAIIRSSCSIFKLPDRNSNNWFTQKCKIKQKYFFHL
jgi:hypothetical protein